MRVLFDHSSPFVLSHGGFQIQIEQTAAALQSLGVEVEFLRWWDQSQRGDLIHYFGRPTGTYVQLAQQKGMKVIIADLLTELGSRSRSRRLAQKAIVESVRRLLPRSFTLRMAWDAFAKADAVIALTGWEAQLMREMFNAPPEKTHVVPNGVEEVFLRTESRPRGPWLVCTATITPRKRVLELAQAAVVAQAPTWIIGKAYASGDAYAEQFEKIARTHPRWVRFDGPVQDRGRLAEIYREARGFVLLSTMESLSLSALEAAACGCPLLLSDLPWARTTFGAAATYCPVQANTDHTASVLKKFYDQAPQLPPPPLPPSWAEVAEEFRALYARLLNTSV